MLDLSLREAFQFGHTYVGAEHLLLGLVREGEGQAARVLTMLGADGADPRPGDTPLTRVRKQVLQALAAGPSAGPERAGAAGPEDGPRCPACRSLLEGHAGYRVLPVRPAPPAEASEVMQVVFVYCLRCGVLLAHTPAVDVGVASEARGQVGPEDG